MKIIFTVFPLFILLMNVNSQNINNEIDIANSFFKKADSLLIADQNTTSINLFNKAAYIFLKYNYLEMYFRSKSKVALNYSKKGEIKKSLKIAEDNLSEILNKLGNNNLELAFCYVILGHIHSIYLSEFDKGFDYFEKALIIQKSFKGKYILDIVFTYDNMGDSYNDNGNYTLALECHNKALKSRLKLFGQKHFSLAHSYTNIGNVYDNKNNYEKALENHQKALKIALETLDNNHPYISGAFYNLGQVYLEFDMNEMALDYLQKALDIDLNIFGENHPYIALSYVNFGFIYLDKNQYDISIDYFRKAINIHLNYWGNSHSELSFFYNNLGLAYTKKGNYKLALYYLNKELSIFKKNYNEDHPYITNIYNCIGNVYFEITDFKQALKYYKKALNKSKILIKDKTPDISRYYNNIGKTYEINGKFSEALKYFQNAICTNIHDFNDSTNIYKNPSISSYYDATVLLETLYHKAIVLTKLSDDKSLKFSLETYSLCDKIIDKIRQSRQKENDKIELCQKATLIYENAIELCLKLHNISSNKFYLEKAFYFAEKNKAGVLKEALSDLNAKKLSLIPDSLLRIEKNLKSELSFYYQELISNQDSTKEKNLRKHLFDLQRTHEKLIIKFEKKYPKYHRLKYDNKIPTIQNIQSFIDKNTSLVEFFIGEKNLFVFVISKIEFKVYKLPNIDGLGYKVKTMINYLSEKDKVNFSNISYQLYEKLFKPLNINNSEIIIVPDGNLWQLNFDLLISKRPKIYDYRKFQYLIKDYTISYTYSAKFLFNDRNNKFQSHKNKCLAFSYNNPNDVSVGNYITMRKGKLTIPNDLPGTRKEINAISNLMNGAYYYGSYASENNFKKNAKNYNILHLALHGEIDNENPMNSKLFFTQNQDPKEDNLLHIFELYNMDLNAEIAVLSACNTGRGKFIKGEGVLSLGRAFKYAGCKSLLLSQWEVSDSFTPIIMEDFYKNLLEGKSKSLALKDAKLDFLSKADNLTSNPFYWASMVQIGDNRPLNIYNQWNWVIKFFTIIFFLLTVVVLYKRRAKFLKK